MNLFGIGNMELIVVFVVATLVLGPNRMVDFARALGQFWGEAQRTLRSTIDAATVKLDEEPARRPTPPREPMSEPQESVARGSGDAADDEDDTADEDGGSGGR